jgi:repressor LexA
MPRRIYYTYVQVKRFLEIFMEPMTERQADILRFIRDEIHSRGCPPTVREIARRFGFASPHAVTDHLDTLVRKGYITRAGRQTSRGIRLTQGVPNGIPLVGRVAAGTPLEAIENLEGHIDLPDHFGSGELFAVRVQGDSMRDAGILEGDCAIVRLQPRIDNGAIGVAILDGAATVKYVFKTHQGYRLQPANPAYQPIEVSPDEHPDFRIAGPMVGLVRKMSRGFG